MGSRAPSGPGPGSTSQGTIRHWVIRQRGEPARDGGAAKNCVIRRTRDRFTRDARVGRNAIMRTNTESSSRKRLHRNVRVVTVLVLVEWIERVSDAPEVESREGLRLKGSNARPIVVADAPSPLASIPMVPALARW